MEADAYVKEIELDGRGFLAPEQQRVLNLVRAGRNVFMTGGGGVGKSHVIATLVAQERELHGRVVAVTASTGVAADQIGGSTLHAFLGLGLAKEPLPKLVQMACSSSKIVSRWRGVDLLVIDEVSMIDPDFFVAVDAVARAVRRTHTPFGGVQVLLVGDFFQLPPVLPRARDESLPVFCFQTDAWREAVHEVVELVHIFRQEGDSALSELLQRARRGVVTPEDVALLKTRVDVSAAALLGGDIQPTRMHARRANVDVINDENLESLQTEPHTFRSSTYWEVKPDKSGAPLPEGVVKARTDMLSRLAPGVANAAAAKGELVLKEGAQVMLLCNLDTSRGLVNGSRGVIVRFTNGQPVVKFARGEEVTVERYTWEHTLEDVGCIYYRQVPLQLAWAVTIHKAQGLSLDCVEMALDSSVFEYGQAYVALSRVRSLAGLRLLSFKPDVIQAHPLVATFYGSLASGPQQPLPSASSVPASKPVTSSAPASSSAPPPPPVAPPRPVVPVVARGPLPSLSQAALAARRGKRPGSGVLLF